MQLPFDIIKVLHAIFPETENSLYWQSSYKNFDLPIEEVSHRS
jgi:hypothetical protein